MTEIYPSLPFTRKVADEWERTREPLIPLCHRYGAHGEAVWAELLRRGFDVSEIRVGS